jgi:hypothetical protein
MISIPGKVNFGSPIALARDPIEYRTEERFETSQFLLSNVPTFELNDKEFIEAMHKVSVPPCKNANDPHQKSIDEINDISSLGSNAEDVPFRKLTLGKSNPRITRTQDRVLLEEIKMGLKKSNSSHDSSQLSSKDISAKKTDRFKERSSLAVKSNKETVKFNQGTVQTFTKTVQSSTETITQDGNLDGKRMGKPVSGEYSIQKDERAGFLSKFEANRQSSLSSEQANDKYQYSLHSKQDNFADLKISGIPTDSPPSRLDSPM